nr:60S ribosomal protein L7-1 [Ipomoea batatas]GMD35594.1 60S ribosomal protein L7-1 [Ipomoea batatas]
MAAPAEDQQPLNYIDEVVLKKRRNNEDWAIRRKLQLEQKVRKLKSDSFVIKKPEQFIREFRDKELDLVRLKQRSKSRRRVSVPPTSKLLFVIRIGGKNDMHPKTRKLLYSLRLRRVFHGVFLKANERTMGILKKVEPYIAYGYVESISTCNAIQWVLLIVVLMIMISFFIPISKYQKGFTGW